MVEIAGAGAGIGIGREIRVIEQTRGLHFVRAEEVSGESTEYTRVVGGGVVEVIMKLVVPALGGSTIVHRAVKGKLPIVLQAIGEQVRRVPVLGIFLIHVAGIAPPS